MRPESASVTIELELCDGLQTPATMLFSFLDDYDFQIEKLIQIRKCAAKAKRDKRHRGVVSSGHIKGENNEQTPDTRL